ncbi:hypothetical protein [Streptomyces sp. NPDC048710]|uniref:hypothetical protein n=1 Tax=Streptomyces sp. NPDC048710 TaxID=3365586 RepID=UPI00370FC69F
MASRPSVSPEEAADQPAIRSLIDAYAHCAGGRDAKGQMSLFTEDSRFLVHMDAGDWFFAERRLLVDWTETRLCAP